MNLSEIARRLRVSTEELRGALPALGFSIGRHAIKVNDREAQRIMESWHEFRKRQRLQEKREAQKAQLEAQKLRPKTPESVVSLPAVLTVREFADRLDLPIVQLMQELLKNGILLALNERIDFETAAIVAEDLGFQAVREDEGQAAGEIEDTAGLDRLSQALSSSGVLNQPRPPVVVVMGHVDHGKTKILDSIRQTHVMETEAGGITQHIGAYQVQRNGRTVTFIDTPGHEAFTVMRSRGAKVADIAILVVAVDDGVQPQTREAIDIIKAAGLSFLVALNKIDKPNADLDRVKGQLAEVNLVPEDWGGQTICVPVSAKTGQGIEQLLDTLLLVADLNKERLVADPSRLAIGTIIESHVDVGEGPVATVLVQTGTLRVGDVLGVRGGFYGRVRSMRDWQGARIKEAPPATPAKILGWKFAPTIGDILEVPADASGLRKVKETLSRSWVKQTSPAPREEKSESKIFYKIIIRADVLGSSEAVLGLLEKIRHEAIGIEVVGKGLGNITDTDILKAEAAGAVIYGFGVKPTVSAQELAREKNVEIKTFSVIYKLFEDVVAAAEKMIPEEKSILELGRLEVLAVFQKTDRGGIFGAKVLGDRVRLKSKMRVLRQGVMVGEGEIISLQIGKQNINEVAPGAECGVGYNGYRVEVGDIIETYFEETKIRRLLTEKDK